MPHWRRKTRNGLPATPSRGSRVRTPYLDRNHPVHNAFDWVMFAVIVAALALLVFGGFYFLRDILAAFIVVADWVNEHIYQTR